MLNSRGYRVLQLKEVTPFFQAGKLTARLSRINPAEIIMFSRQLALLLESGNDIVTSLGLLQAQVSSRNFKKVIGEVIEDIRAGISLSEALSKHPRAFPPIYHRLVAVGERTGELETVIRRAADYMERVVTTQKSVKNALIYPAILCIVAIMVIGVLVSFVFPALANLYESFDVQLPAITRAFMSVTGWLHSYGIWLGLVVVVAAVGAFAYTRTPKGKYRWDKLTLSLPCIGRINLLNELSRACRSMSLLYVGGIPLPEIMTLIAQGTNNKVIAGALTEVQQSMIAGQGLSAPMRRNKLFPPLMVQMSAVGEETGNLEDTLTTVAESYETQAGDATKSLVSLITPVLTIIIAAIVGIVALSMVSAMYSIYGQI